LETPLHAYLAEHDSRYVRACREFASFEFVEDFFLSAVPTVAVLLLHVRHFAAEEEARARVRLQEDVKLRDFLGGEPSMGARFFQLPWAEIDQAYQDFVDAGLSARRARSRVNELESLVRGILTQRL
jgi:hypothetical protein